MGHKTAKTMGWQYLGGTFSIPDGWFVHKVDLDAAEPYAEITSHETNEEQTIILPKCLAYYLGTHFCGSEVMRSLIEADTRHRIAQTIKGALGV